MITENKRAFKRVKRDFKIKYKSHKDTEKLRTGTSITKNISMGGVYFTSTDMFDVGELISCVITIEGDKTPGEWTARVVRCERSSKGLIDVFGIAAEFVKSLGDSDKVLKKNIER